CAGSIPVPAVGTSTYYSVEFRPSPPVQQDFTVSWDVTGLTGIIQTHQDLEGDSPIAVALRATGTKCHVKIESGLAGPATGHFTCDTSFTSYGTFAVYMRQPGGPRVQVATAPALFVPNQANVAGEIHSAYSQMPGTKSTPE